MSLTTRTNSDKETDTAVSDLDDCSESGLEYLAERPKGTTLAAQVWGLVRFQSHKATARTATSAIVSSQPGHQKPKVEL